MPALSALHAPTLSTCTCKAESAGVLEAFLIQSVHGQTPVSQSERERERERGRERKREREKEGGDKERVKGE
jgi:hypothetical protein